MSAKLAFTLLGTVNATGQGAVVVSSVDASVYGLLIEPETDTLWVTETVHGAKIIIHWHRIGFLRERTEWLTAPEGIPSVAWAALRHVLPHETRQRMAFIERSGGVAALYAALDATADPNRPSDRRELLREAALVGLDTPEFRERLAKFRRRGDPMACWVSGRLGMPPPAE